MKLVEGKCPNCGAILKVDPSKDAAFCEYCGTPYVVEKAIKNYHIGDVNTTINIDNHQENEKAEFWKFMSKYGGFIGLMFMWLICLIILFLMIYVF